MSAATWSEGGQPSGPMHNNGPFQGPPPSCYNCGGQHYLVNCPEQKRSAPAGLNTPPGINANQQNGYGPSGGNYSQDPQWASSQNGSVATFYPAPKPPLPATQYTGPGGSRQFSNPSGSYGPPAVPQYQQYSGVTPPSQSYPPPQTSYHPNPQPSGPPGPPPAYIGQPPPQSYSAFPAAQQYGNPGYQAPPQNLYSQPNGPLQFGNPVYQNPPQQYAPHSAVTPYPQPSNSYPSQSTSYAEPSSVQIQTPQWSDTTPNSSYAASPFQPTPSNPHFNPGFEREYSGTSRQHSMSQPNQTPQHEYESEAHRVTPTPATISKLTQPAPGLMTQDSPSNQTLPSGFAAGSKPSSHASTPHPRRTSTGSTQQTGHRESATPSIKDVEDPDTKMEEIVQYEDGELTEEDLHEQEFNWEFKMIFSEQPLTENVRLAQPLSTTWESTPVPLLDSRLNNSVSRYARKENLKDFIRPIRSQPQWSYLKDDPAFSNSKLEEGPLIPLHEVPAWMAARHGTELPDTDGPSPSRKRARSEEEDEQEDIDNQIKQEAATEHLSGTIPSKRQKNEDTEDENTIIVKTEKIPTGRPGTPTFGRDGTPSLGTDDDVWAPQPGEGAVPAPIDPTEALLASLGVSGSPKPIRKSSVPLPTTESAQSTPPYAGAPQSMSPQSNQPISHNMPPQANLPYTNPSQGAPRQFNPSYNNSSDSFSPHSHYTNGMSPQGNFHVNQQYKLPRQNSYGSGMSPPSNTPTNQPYGMPRQNSYGNSMTPQGNSPHAVQQYGMPRQNSYTNDNQQQSVNVYNSHAQGVPLQPQYQPQNQYVSPQGNAPYGTYPQHAIPNNAPYGNTSYIATPQPYPPLNQYNGVPLQNNASYPQNGGPYTQVNAPQGNPNYGHPPYGGPQHGPPVHQSHNNNFQGFQQPLRQDSGYVSARGSYSNDSEMNQGQPNMKSQQQHPEPSPSQPHGPLDGSNDTPTPPKSEPEETNFFASLPSQFPRKSKSEAPKVKLGDVKTENISGQEAEREESPLSPTSLEILGRLIPESGRKSDTSRQGEDGVTRKIKRPQPVVAAAYSRRW